MNSNEAPAIETRGLTKRYDKILAVNGIGFEVKAGEIFGFLGPNGAGKTTTLMMITTFLEPTSGEIRIHGYNLPRESLKARALMGIVPEESNVYMELTTEANLLFAGRIYGMSKKARKQRASELLEIFGLSGKARVKAQELSKGMRRRLTMGMALMHNPTLLFLDEPISGLDVQSTIYIKKLVRELNASGVTVFLTTHQIGVASELCHRVAIINNGSIATIGTPDELRDSIESVQTVEVAFDVPDGRDLKSLASIPGVTHEMVTGNRLRLYTDNPSQVIPAVVDFARENSLRITSLNTIGPSLEDVFLKITGQEVGTAPVQSEAKRGKGRKKGGATQ